MLPDTVVRLPAGMVLALIPATVWDTRTLKLQLSPAGSAPPGITLFRAIVRVVRPVTAEIVVAAGRVTATPLEKQAADSVGGLAMRMFVGKMSRRMLVTVLLTVLGLDMTMVSVAVPVVPVEVTGLKDLLMVGAFGREMFCTWKLADAATVLLPAVVVKAPAGMSLL